MKEVTYGWYPSAKDVYKPKGRPGSYHLECLYKHGDSMYYLGSTGPPQGELFVRGITDATPPATPPFRKSRSVPVPKFSRVPKLNISTPTQCWSSSTHKKNLNETAWGVVGDETTYAPAPPTEVSWPLPKGKQPRKQQGQQGQQARPDQMNYQKYFQKQLLQRHIQQQKDTSALNGSQGPQFAWGFRPANQDGPPSVRSEGCSSDLAWPRAHKPADRPQTALTDRPKEPATTGSRQKPRPASSPVKSPGQTKTRASTPGRLTPAPPDGRGTSGARRVSRIQSATVRREKTPLPARPVTAASNRPESVKQVAARELDPFDDDQRPASRPAAPVPFVYDVNDDWRGSLENLSDDVIPRELGQSEDESYEAILDKYGWRAEVHGDPYKLKRPLKRVSYAVQCEEPELPPEPPKVHMETNEPFFLNTIPHRPLSFTVDKQWMSEVLVAKRLEMQKRDGGVKYCYKNFAFAY